MAIFRKKTRQAIDFERVMCGGSREPDPSERVADFSYENETLAQMIVHAWTDQTFRTKILKRKRNGTSPNAKAELAERGIFLKNPVVITEDEYNDGYHMKDRNGVVFVLPNQARAVTPPSGETLLETARLLMACTPNGI